MISWPENGLPALLPHALDGEGLDAEPVEESVVARRHSRRLLQRHRQESSQGALVTLPCVCNIRMFPGFCL